MRPPYTYDLVYSILTHTLSHGHYLSDKSAAVVAKAVFKLPPDIVDFSLHRVVFISADLPPKNPAFSLTKKSDLWVGKRGFVFITDHLLRETEKEQAFVIAHEIAHLKLNHYLSHYSLEEEKEANALAEKWLGYRIY
jgi:predicted Zn-dependent protease